METIHYVPKASARIALSILRLKGLRRQEEIALAVKHYRRTGLVSMREYVSHLAEQSGLTFQDCLDRF